MKTTITKEWLVSRISQYAEAESNAIAASNPVRKAYWTGQRVALQTVLNRLLSDEELHSSSADEL